MDDLSLTTSSRWERHRLGHWQSSLGRRRPPRRGKARQRTANACRHRPIGGDGRPRAPPSRIPACLPVPLPQHPLEPGPNLLGTTQLALPDGDHRPSESTEGRGSPAVPLHVALELLQPERSACRRRGRVPVTCWRRSDSPLTGGTSTTIGGRTVRWRTLRRRSTHLGLPPLRSGLRPFAPHRQAEEPRLSWKPPDSHNAGPENGGSSQELGLALDLLLVQELDAVLWVRTGCHQSSAPLPLRSASAINFLSCSGVRFFAARSSAGICSGSFRMMFLTSSGMRPASAIQ